MNQAPSSSYPDTPKMIQWVMKYSGGLVKNEKQASYVLLGFVVAAIIIALIQLLRFSGIVSIKQSPSISPEQQLEDYRRVQPF